MWTHLPALVEPLSVAWHGISLSTLISPHTCALVIGGGPIGCAVILSLRAKGVTNISVSEPSASRREMAASLGAAQVLNPQECSVSEILLKQGSGDGVDVVFDCAGVPASMDLSCAAVRSRGEIVNLALWAGPIQFDPNALQGKEASWRPSMCYTSEDIQEVIEALGQKRMDPRPMITRKIKLENVVAEGFEVLHQVGGEHCKILIDLQEV